MGFVEGADAPVWLPRGQDSNVQGKPKLPMSASAKVFMPDTQTCRSVNCMEPFLYFTDSCCAQSRSAKHRREDQKRGQSCLRACEARVGRSRRTSTRSPSQKSNALSYVTLFVHACSIFSQGHDRWGSSYAAWGSGYDQTGYSCAQAYHPACSQAPAYNQCYDPSWNNQMGYAQAGVQS